MKSKLLNKIFFNINKHKILTIEETSKKDINKVKIWLAKCPKYSAQCTMAACDVSG